MKDFKETFKNDYIETKKYYIRPFSILWWLAKVGTILLFVSGSLGFYFIIAWLAV